MARKKISLTFEHIALISNIQFKKLDLHTKFTDFDGKTTYQEPFENQYYGIDTFNLYRGSFLYEEMARILGLQGEIIEGTEEEPTGPRYSEKATQKMDELDGYLIENLSDIEDIIHQFLTEGLREGEYTKSLMSGLWEYKPFKK